MKESELCDLLKQEAEQLGFRYFAEYMDWDAVLIRKKAIIGVQAKISMNAKAIAQTVKAGGVNFKVIVTNNYQFKIGDDWSVITNALRIIHLTHFNNSFHMVNNVNTYNNYWLRRFRFKPKKLLEIPNFDYFTPSGVPGPRRVTERNIATVKLELVALAQGGYVTIADARKLGLDRVSRRYFDYQWRTKNWLLKPSPYRPSDDYQHIWAGLHGK